MEVGDKVSGEGGNIKIPFLNLKLCIKSAA